MKCKLGRALALLALTSACALPAAAQTFEGWTKPVRVIVPIGPGSGMDITSRVFGQYLAEELKTPVVVENKPGADGSIAVRELLRGGPDGHSLLTIPDTVVSLNPFITPDAYDPKSFRPLFGMTMSTPVLLVRAEDGYQKLEDLLKQAREQPGKVPFGTYGIVYRFGLERLGKATNVSFMDVPYKGSASAALNDLLGGNIRAMFMDSAAALPQVQSGRLKALAVMGPERLPSFPDLPTVQESGYGQFAMQTWIGMAIAADTPPHIAQALEAAALRTLKHEGMQKYAAERGVQLFEADSAKLATLLERDTAMYKDLVANSDILKGARGK